MTGLDERSGVEYPQQNVEEVRAMPVRRCPYCKALCNFSVEAQVSGRDTAGYIIPHLISGRIKVARRR